jgi:hypothetical protein
MDVDDNVDRRSHTRAPTHMLTFVDNLQEFRNTSDNCLPMRVVQSGRIQH